MVAQMLITAAAAVTGAASWAGQFKISQPAKTEAKATRPGPWTLKGLT